MNNSLLKSHLKCKRKAWLDLKGNKYYKNWSPQQSIQLMIEFENFKQFTEGDLFKGIKACEKGYKGVIGLTMRQSIKKYIRVEVKPSLLIKTEGKSVWGEYKYIPVVSKLGKRTTREHILDLALCSIVLEKEQDSEVDYGLVISRSQNNLETEKIYISDKLKNKVIYKFSELIESLRGNIPAITENRKKCAICTWQNFCNKEAKFAGDLTDIDGIGSKTSLILKNIGIDTTSELAKYNKSELNKKLSRILGESIEKSSRYIDQAKSYISGSPIKISSKYNYFDKIFSDKSGFIVFDIESNPEENHDFLYGFISTKNLFHEIEDKFYDPILNLNNKISKKFFKEIYEKLNSHSDWPILHYGETEKIIIIKLAKKFNLTELEIEDLKSRFVDLHQIVRNHWILPIKNYSLKTVANWMGFCWEQKHASGSKALFWWILYKITNKKIFLEKIIKYNKDDCLATLHIARWLFKNGAKN